MSQLVIISQFMRYLDVASVDYIDDLTKQDLDPVVLEKLTKENVEHVKEFKTSLNKGHCYGFCLSHAAMDYAGKLNWWEHALIAMNNWDGKIASLDELLTIPGADNDKPTTLRKLFERALSYVIPAHANADNEFQSRFNFSGINQSNILSPNRGFFELLVRDGEKEKILTIKSRRLIAGYFSQADLMALLTEECIENRICIIRNKKHSVRVGFDGENWILYDPNYSHSNPESIHIITKNKMEIVHGILIQLATNSLCIEVAGFTDDKIHFPHYREMIEGSPAALLAEDGFHMILANTYQHLPYLFARANSADENGFNLRSAIARALIKRDMRNWSTLHTLAQNEPQDLVYLFELAKRKDGEGLRYSIAATLADKNADGLTPFQIIVRQTPEYLPKLAELAHENASDKIRASIAKALLAQTKDGMTGFYSVAFYAPEFLPRLLALADRDDGQEIRAAIAAALPMKTNTNDTALHLLSQVAPAVLTQLDDQIKKAKTQMVAQCKIAIDDLQLSSNLVGLLNMLDEIINNPTHFLKYQRDGVVINKLFGGYGATNSYREVINYGIEKIVSLLKSDKPNIDINLMLRLEQLEKTTKKPSIYQSDLRQALNQLNNVSVAKQNNRTI